MMPCSFCPHLVSVQSHLLVSPYHHTIHLTKIILGSVIFLTIYLSYITWELLIVPSGNSYHTSIMLVGRFFWIRFIFTESVPLIVSPTYSIYDASKRQNRFCLCLLSAVICNNAYAYLWLFDYLQDGKLYMLVHLQKCFSSIEITE